MFLPLPGHRIGVTPNSGEPPVARRRASVSLLGPKPGPTWQPLYTSSLPPTCRAQLSACSTPPPLWFLVLNLSHPFVIQRSRVHRTLSILKLLILAIHLIQRPTVLDTVSAERLFPEPLAFLIFTPRSFHTPGPSQVFVGFL